MVIVAALSIEIAPLLNALSAKKIKAYSNKTALYRANGIDLLITGVGPVMAERTLVAYLNDHQPESLLNIGTAGLLDRHLEIGTVYPISSVCDRSDHEIRLTPIEGEVGERCLSVSRGIEDPVSRDQFFKEYKATLADMECYTFARIAQSREIPMSAMKVTTDYADCETRDMFEKQVKNGVKELTNKVLNIIQQS